MKTTYEQAYRTLVLTDELDGVPGDISPFQLFMRLYCCPRMNRLWNLQEGVLGRALYFWVNRRTTSYEELLKKFHDDLYRNASLPVAMNLHQQIQHWRELGVAEWQTVDGRPDLAAKIAKLQTAMQFRKTTKPEDEAICLANLLNLDLAPVLRSRAPAERMKQLWQSLAEVPVQLLFCVGTRIPFEPFHWTPISLLGTAGNRVNDGKRAQCREDGLHVRSPGWILLPGTHPLQADFYFREEHHAEYFMVLGDRQGQDRRADPPPARLAIVSPRDVVAYRRKPQVSFDGVIVSILPSAGDDDGTTITARYEEKLRIAPVQPHIWPERRKQEESDQEKLLRRERKTRRYCTASILPPDQAWVIR